MKTPRPRDYRPIILGVLVTVVIVAEWAWLYYWSGAR